MSECETHRVGLCCEHCAHSQNQAESAEIELGKYHEFEIIKSLGSSLATRVVSPHLARLLKQTLSKMRNCTEDPGAKVADSGETEYRDLFPGRMIKSVVVSNVLKTFTSRTYSCKDIVQC